VTRGLEEIADRETSGAVQRLEGALADAGSLEATLLDVRGRKALHLKNQAGDQLTYLNMPHLSAARDIFAERRVITSRLTEMERSEFTAATIDRLEAESEFRFALAWPLIAVIFALASRSGDLLWLTLIPVPVLLMLHGVSLHRSASRELVDMLRTRKPEVLAELTPVYQRFNEDAEALSAAMRTLGGPDVADPSAE
jgi:hypothetical protein